MTSIETTITTHYGLTQDHVKHVFEHLDFDTLAGLVVEVSKLDVTTNNPYLTGPEYLTEYNVEIKNTVQKKWKCI